MNDLLEICDFYLDAHVWPLDPVLEPARWLSNFTPAEQSYAVDLLTAFTFINDKMAKAILRSCIERLSQRYVDGRGVTKAEAWNIFMAEAAFTTVDMQEQNLTASGPQICRWARYSLEIHETKFFTVSAVLEKLMSGKASAVIFLDDFMGTGDQFIGTWQAPMNINGKTISLKELVPTLDVPIIYAPLVATTHGLEQVRAYCDGLDILPGNVLDSTYSTLSSDSAVWSAQNKAGSLEFLRATAKRAGIESWKGYGDLGLTLSFSHCIPDATLPIFSFKEHGWKPLIRLG